MVWSRWLLVSLVLETSFLIVISKNCQKVPGHVCSCELDNGTLISLDAISGSKSPVFSDVQVSGSGADGRKYLYYYDPCRSFMLPAAGDACNGVSVCQKDVPANMYYNLGELGRTTFGWDEARGLIYISYTGCDGQQCRHTNVSLQCDWSMKDATLEVFPQNPAAPLEYNMTLTSRCACPGGCPDERPMGQGMTAGGVFLTLLVGVAAFYLLVGIAYRRIVVGATGWEVIPNRKFWVGLPGLVRDGITYCITCRRADTAYDQI